MIGSKINYSILTSSSINIEKINFKHIMFLILSNLVKLNLFKYLTYIIK